LAQLSFGEQRFGLGVTVLDALDADAVRRWASAATRIVQDHRTAIDALNVYPVPDGDTGTNMAHTLAASEQALNEAEVDTAGAALQVLARGAVLGARGNSGVILSQILRGIADVAAGSDEVAGVTLRAALRQGADDARTAVAAPVEGTILTVIRAAADADPAEDSLAGVVRAAVAGAADALAHTPEQLADLARAGVVDAGGQGLVLVLQALAHVVCGDPLPDPVRSRASIARRVAREAGSGEFAFEVQYLLDADDDAGTALRESLDVLGDSVAVVGTGDGTWNVHVHVNDIGGAIEAGLDIGRPRRISVVQFADDCANDRGDSPGSAVVAVAPGDGLGHLFEAEGVCVVDGRRPSVEEVLAAVRETRATEVVLLPNASQVAGVAEAAAERARADGTRVTVVPTRSPVQGLAAVAVHDPMRRFDDDVVAMAEAAAATRFAEITIAEREALTSVGVCQQGDVLGLIDGEVVEIGRGLIAVVFAVTDRLLGVGADLLTVLVGSDAPPGIGDLIEQHVRERSRLTEVSVYSGGQPKYPVIIGVE
jgi:DAK2 domain fusion protein YloV